MKRKLVIVFGFGGLAKELVNLIIRHPETDVLVVNKRNISVDDVSDPDRVANYNVGIYEWFDYTTAMLSTSMCDDADVALLNSHEFIGAIWTHGVNKVQDTVKIMDGSIKDMLTDNALAPAMCFIEIARSLMFQGENAVNVTLWDQQGTQINLPFWINVGSTASNGAGAGSLGYVMSKHAMSGMTKSLQRDFNGKWLVSQYNPPKFSGTNMSTLIEEGQAKLRNVSVAEERARQRASAVGGREPDAHQIARWIYDTCIKTNGRPEIHEWHGF